MKKNTEPRIFKSYPEMLPIFVALFISGILLSDYFSNDLYITWLGISLATFTFSFFTQSPKSKTIALFTAALSASMFYGSIRHNDRYNFSDLLFLDNTQGVLEGRYTGQSRPESLFWEI